MAPFLEFVTFDFYITANKKTIADNEKNDF